MPKINRVLHVLGGLDIGGAETMVMNFYRNIDKNKFQFDFVVHGEDVGFYEKEIRSLGGIIYRVPKYKVYNHYQYQKAWKNLFNEHPEYKIVHSHVRSTASIICKIAKSFDIKTVVHSHSTSNGKGIVSIIKFLLQLNIRSVSDFFIGCSKESAVWLFGKRVADSNRCFVLNNAIDAERFLYNEETRKKIRKQLELENKLVLGQVGRFVNVKNHQFTLRVLEKYVKKNKDTCLLLVGDGPLKDDILNLISKLNLKDYVLMLNNRSDVNELMQAMDVFLMPSLYEGLPLTLVEAQTASLPCVISEKITAGKLIKSLIKEIRLEDEQQWLKAFDLVDATQRKNRKNEIVNAGFDIKANVKQLQDFYFYILSKK